MSSFLAAGEHAPLVIALIVVLVAVQWPLSMLALYRLFSEKPGKRAAILWNIFIVAGVIVGPVAFLIRHAVRKQRAARTPPGEPPAAAE